MQKESLTYLTYHLDILYNFSLKCQEDITEYKNKSK